MDDRAIRTCAGAKVRRRLVKRVLLLANGQLAGQSCRNIIAPDLRSDLHLIRSGRHFIIYLETSRNIRIIDVLHQSSDLMSRLADIGPLD